MLDRCCGNEVLCVVMRHITCVGRVSGYCGQCLVNLGTLKAQEGSRLLCLALVETGGEDLGRTWGKDFASSVWKPSSEPQLTDDKVD